MSKNETTTQQNTGLPPCGVYKTTVQLGEVPANRLIYFHNHGNPGAGVYQPSTWRGNRARFHEKGTTLAKPELAFTLKALAAEGFYRVAEAFFCCDKECRRYEADMLVQLGYDQEATPILFTPEIIDGEMKVPEMGTRIDEGRISKMKMLLVPVTSHGDQGDNDERAILH